MRTSVGGGAVVLAAAVLACGLPDAPTPLDAGTVRIALSESTLPMIERVAAEYAAPSAPPRVDLLPPMHSSGAVAATHLGDADLGIVSRPLTADEKAFGLRYIHVARDPLLFATHPGVGLAGLTSRAIREIYAGEITNWREVGGPDRSIVVLDRGEHTSPKRALRAELLCDIEITPEAIVLERPGMMTDSLQSIEGAIGFSTLGQILTTDIDVAVLEIDGAAPSITNVASGRYRWAVPVGLVLPPTPGRAAMRFVEYLIGERARPSIEAMGYGPIVVNLVIGTVPEQNVIRQEERFRPLADHLSNVLGSKTEVRLHHLASYDDVVREFHAGGVNAAFLGSYTYAVAHRQLGVEPLVRPEVGGVSEYRGLILVRRDGPIRDWQDLRGARFAMVEDTTAGELFPRLFLRRLGVENAESFLGEIDYAASHEASIRKLLAGEVAAAGAKDLILDRMVRMDPSVADRLEVLATSPAVPENTLVIRRDFEVACLACHGQDGTAEPGAGGFVRLDDVLRRDLLALGAGSEGRAILEILGADRFVETRDADYAPVYAMIDELGGELDDLRREPR